jgi:hypothetical protein
LRLHPQPPHPPSSPTIIIIIMIIMTKRPRHLPSHHNRIVATGLENILGVLLLSAGRLRKVFRFIHIHILQGE